MKWILFLPRLVWKVWFLIYMLFSTIVLFPFIFVFIVVLKNYSLTFNTIYKIWAWSICIFIGIIPSIENKKLIPKNDSFVIVANHSSQLDIIIPYTQFKQHFAFLAKEELKKKLSGRNYVK